MSKNYFGKSSTVIVAVGFLALLSTGANAQTTEDAKVLRSQTDLKALASSRSKVNRMVVSDQRLKDFAKKNAVPYRFEGKDGKVVQLVAIDGVGNPIYLSTTNEKAAITSGANLVRKGGGLGYDLTGKDVKVVEWDGGRVRGTHRELVGKITVGADTGTVISTFSNHATHVAGTILATGVDRKAKGMAPESTILSYDFNSSWPEIYESLNNQEGVISTHSYGYNAGWASNGISYVWYGDDNVSTTQDYKFGYYSEYDEFADGILRAAPWHTLVKSAGNSRGAGPTSRPNGQELNGGDTGFDTVPFGVTFKNGIVVGAVQPVLDYYNDKPNVPMTSFSSWGPTDDGRIVPTLVADGYEVYSSVSTSDEAYSSMSGTSMATPATTGAIALLQEFAKKKTSRYFTSPLVKALLINTTKEAGNEGPDYTYGYGLLDIKKAIETVDYKGKSTEYREGNLTNGETVTLKFKTQEGVPFRASLAWLDREGKPKAYLSDKAKKDPSFLNDRTPQLVDDLDLRVTQNGVEYMPYVLDPNNPAAPATMGDNVLDNMEQVYIPNPTTGEVTLTFTHKGTLPTDGVNYGLVVSGISVEKDLTMSELTATVSNTELSADAVVKAVVKNTGSTDFGGFKVKFSLIDPAGTVVSTKELEAVSLAAGESKDILEKIDLQDTFVKYTVKAEIVSADDMVAGNNIATTTATSSLIDLRAGGSLMLEDFNSESLDDHDWKIVNQKDGTATWELYTLPWTLDGTQSVVSINAGDVADDWLLTNPVLLAAGKTYRVTYYTSKNSESTARNENVEVFLGDTQDVAAMTTSLNKYTWNQADDSAVFKKVQFDFVAPKDGLQYFGIRHFSDEGKTSWILALDNFKVVNMEDGVPAPDFTYTIQDGTNVITKYTDVQLDNATPDTSSENKWEWSIVPNTVEFKDGTSKNSESPVVRFLEEGPYTVKLTATNDKGSAHKTKYSYLEVVTPTTKANFSLDRNSVYSQENVQFQNLTAGSPVANSYKWTITPNELGAFSFLEGTSETSEHINVKFAKAGTYTVKLEATSEAGTVETQMTDAVKVLYNDNPPLNLAGTFDSGSVSLAWEKPKAQYLTSYIDEDFNRATFPPAKWQVLDGNSDGNTWKSFLLQGGRMVAGVYSYINETRTAVRTDDYLVTKKVDFLPEGYNELTFNSFGDADYPDNMKIYYVKVSDDSPLTAEQITAGTLVFDGTTITASSTFNKVSLKDLYDGTPFRLAFYSSNYDKFLLSLDNVKISAPNTITSRMATTTLAPNELVSRELVRVAHETANGGLVVGVNAVSTKPEWEQIEVGPSQNITNYEVYRGGNFLASVAGTETVFVDNSVTQVGTYCYNVVAVYDGVNKSTQSNEVCVDVTDANLSVADVQKAGQMAAYPNPVVDVVRVKFAEKLSSEAEVSIYALDGKKVLSKTLSEAVLSQQGLDLSQLSSGAYVMVVKSNGKSFTTKLIKK